MSLEIEHTELHPPLSSFSFLNSLRTRTPCNSSPRRCCAAAGSCRPWRRAGNADASSRRSDQSPERRSQETAGGAAAGTTISIITSMDSLNGKQFTCHVLMPPSHQMYKSLFLKQTADSSTHFYLSILKYIPANAAAFPFVLHLRKHSKYD